MPNTLIDANGFKERFDIDSAIATQRIELHVVSASSRLRRWVGDEAYLAALVLNAETPTEETEPVLLTTEYQKLNDFKNAEAHLAFHYALLGMNSPLGPKGVLKIAKTEGDATHQYLSPTEMATLSTYFLDLAREICEPYMLSDGTPDPPFETVVADEC